MHNFIQRNKKMLLAVFGVLLMIVFTLPYTAFSGRGAADVTAGKVGDAKVSVADVERAARELRALGMIAQQIEGQSADQQYQFMGLLFREYHDKPVTYLLLGREAEANGVVPAADAVENLAELLATVVQSRQVDVVPRDAARRFLSVMAGLDRAQGRVKVTMPEVLSAVAVEQQPTASLVEFRADDFLKDVPAPTPQDVRAAYDKYAAVEPRSAAGISATQPARFGYLRPTRVKLQYVALSKERLGEAAVASLSAADLYDVDRVAVGYYKANQDEFEVKRDMDLYYGPTTSPTFRRFGSVRDEIRRKLLVGDAKPAEETSAELSARLQEVRAKVVDRIAALRAQVQDRLAADFRAHERGEPLAPTTAPSVPAAASPATAAAPATAPGATAVAAAAAVRPAPPLPPFESPAYLEAVLADVLRRSGVDAPAPTPWLSKITTPLFAVDFGVIAGPARAGHALDDKWYTAGALGEAGGISLATAGPERFASLVVRARPPESAATAPAATATAPAATPAPLPTSAPASAPSATGLAASGPASTNLASTGPATAASTEAPPPPPRPAVASAWKLYEPSPLLVSASSGDGYVFRLTAYEGERVPSLDKIRDTIAQDLKLNAAYNEAGRAAHALLEAAKAVTARPEGGLPAAAEYGAAKVVVAGPLSPQSPGIPGYPVSDLDSAKLLQRAIGELAAKATPAQPHPTTEVGLASLGRVLAVELRSVERGWTKADDFARQREIVQLVRVTGGRRLLGDWLDPEKVAKRVGYVSTGK